MLLPKCPSKSFEYYCSSSNECKFKVNLEDQSSINIPAFTPELPTVSTGWQCPICKRVNVPSEKVCMCYLEDKMLKGDDLCQKLK
jgi:hypothetical protein